MGRYGIKDIFVTLQGEGTRAGTKAVFCRFTGCNLWDGHPLHRDRGAGSCARWCDTDFFKGKVFGTEELVTQANAAWGVPLHGEKWIVLTGGEPCLQIDHELMSALHDDGWKIAIETNGTEENAAALEADHICVAPKLLRDGSPSVLVLGRADEVKVVLPGAPLGGEGWTATMLAHLEMFVAQQWSVPPAGAPRLFVQPQDPLIDESLVQETSLVRTNSTPTKDLEAALAAQFDRNVARCMDHVLTNPRWSLSLQTHKFIGLS